MGPISGPGPAALSIFWRAALRVLVPSTSTRPFISLSCSREHDRVAKSCVDASGPLVAGGTFSGSGKITSQQEFSAAGQGSMNDDVDAIRRVLAADVESFRRLVERYQTAAAVDTDPPPDTIRFRPCGRGPRAVPGRVPIPGIVRTKAVAILDLAVHHRPQPLPQQTRPPAAVRGRPPAARRRSEFA